MQNNITKQVVILAGMPRTGSSYLYHVLQNHPNLFLPHRKELSFFCSNYKKGEMWYANFFNSINSNELGLDISPVYFLDPASIQRIKQFNSNIKIILCIRTPSDWILSWYSQLLSHELHLPPFDSFIKNHWFKPSIGDKIQINLGQNYISHTINEYVKIFDDKVLIYHYDFFKKDPLLLLRYFEQFLNLPDYYNEENFENIIINAGNRKNVWLVSYLLSRESTVRLLEFCIPKKKLQRIRNSFDRGSTPNGGLNNRIYTKENIQLAKDFFHDDDKFVDSFFSSHPIQLGNGKTFDLS